MLIYRGRKSLGLLIGLIVLIGLFTLVYTIRSLRQGHSKNVKPLFEQKYQAWVQYCSEVFSTSPLLAARSDIDPKVFFDNESFREIVRLGVPAIPYLIEKQQEDHMVGYALYQITKWKWHKIREGKKPGEWVWTLEEFPDIRDERGPPDSRKLWLRWWKEGRKLTDQRFASLYEKWSILKKQKKDKEAEDVYHRMIDLGIAALPNIVDKVKAGSTELIPAISDLTDGEVEKTAKASECLAWWKKSKEKWLIPFPDTKVHRTVVWPIFFVTAGLQVPATIFGLTRYGMTIGYGKRHIRRQTVF